MSYCYELRERDSGITLGIWTQKYAADGTWVEHLDRDPNVMMLRHSDEGEEFFDAEGNRVRDYRYAVRRQRVFYGPVEVPQGKYSQQTQGIVHPVTRRGKSRVKDEDGHWVPE